MKAIVLSLLLLVILTNVFADGRGSNDHGKGWNSQGNDDRRKVDASVSSAGDDVNLRSSRNSHGNDVVHFGFSIRGPPRWLLRYFADNDTTDQPSSSARWALWKLVEYTESGAAQGFQPGSDTIVNQFKLWNRGGWSKLKVNVTQVDGTNVYTLCTSLIQRPNRGRDDGRPDDRTSNPFIFTVCTTLTDSNATVNGTQASPNALKWSLLLEGYAYASNNTHLALKVGIDSDNDVRHFDDKDAENPGTNNTLKVSTTGDVTTAVSWTEYVETVGDNCSETASVLVSPVYNGDPAGDADTDFPSGDEDDIKWNRKVRVLYFSFLTDCQPDSIFWDPEFGVITPPQQTGSATSVSVMPFVTLLAALAVYLL